MWCMVRSITFYGRDSSINSACNHHHSARLLTILHQPQPQITSHRNRLRKPLQRQMLPACRRLYPQTELHCTLRVWRNSIYTKSWEGDSWISSTGYHQHPIARPSTTTSGTPWSKRSTVEDARHLKILNSSRKISNRFGAAAANSKC